MSTDDYSARLEHEVLILENSKISRTYEWNGGNLITKKIVDKSTGKFWEMNSEIPDLSFPGQTKIASRGCFNTRINQETAISPEHLEVEIIYSLDQLEIKRIFRIYRDCPAIACDLYLRGRTESDWLSEKTDLTSWATLARIGDGSAGDIMPVIEKIELEGRHWELSIVEFLDFTDRYNTLVLPVKALSYLPNVYRGNILFAHDKLSDQGIYILKEAPVSNAQLSYPGCDFITVFGTFMTTGVGLNPADLDTCEWCHGYGFVTGVYAGSEKNSLVALREYQKNIRIHKEGRDEMVMMNTWGDLNGDGRINKKFLLNEKFALSELEAGAKLGISHFQLDAGWQKGNGDLKFGLDGYFDNIWSKNDYWKPDPNRFPNGLTPIVERGKELGIEVCLWFNPDRVNSNQNWEMDADVLIGMYEKYGIRTFKIDGIHLPDKLAEKNFRKFLTKILNKTDDNAVFNFDATYGERGGYHYLNRYGNIFLENRFTDWQSYYPYTTLRNIWMISKYVPPQNFQVEFLNKWRNPSVYGADPFGPANYPFEYLFAITMVAQPLAWFEGTGLPDEAFSIAPVVKKYRKIQADFHSGHIFPIGDEPSGKSWSGFQSVQKNKGYFLIFREDNDIEEYEMKTWLSPGTKIKCTQVLGNGAAFHDEAGDEGAVSFRLEEKNSYALYKYAVE